MVFSAFDLLNILILQNKVIDEFEVVGDVSVVRAVILPLAVHKLISQTHFYKHVVWNPVFLQRMLQPFPGSIPVFMNIFLNV